MQKIANRVFLLLGAMVMLSCSGGGNGSIVDLLNQSGNLVPNPPAQVTASDAVFSDKIQITWPAVSGDNVSYQVQRASSATGSYSTLATVTNTEYADLGLGAGKTWYYQIITLRNDQISSASQADAGSTANLPPAPLSLVASKGTFADHIAVSWNAVSGAAGYAIYRGLSAAGPFQLVGNTTATSYNDTAVSISAQYYVVKSRFDYPDGSLYSANSNVDFGSYQAVAVAPSFSPAILTNQNVVATLSSSYPVTITNNGGSNLFTFTANGSFTFNYTDATGAANSSTATVTWIDKTAPVIQVYSMANGASYNFLTNVVTISGVVTETNPGSVQISLDGGPALYTVLASNNFSYNLTLPDNLPHVIAVKATDAAGNTSTNTYNLTWVNTSAIAITNPVSGDVFVSNSVNFFGTASTADLGGITAIDLYITYNGVITGPFAATGTTAWSYSSTGLPWNVPVSVQARMTTAAGQYYSNVINVTCQQVMTASLPAVAVPANETYSTAVAYPAMVNPIVIAAVAPGVDVPGRYVKSSNPVNQEDNDAALVIAKVNNATSQVQFKVINPNPATTRAVSENIHYFMVDAGTYTLSNGAMLQAGSFTGVADANTLVTFPTPFPVGATVLVFAQRVSENKLNANSTNAKFFTLRIPAITNTDFSVRYRVDDTVDILPVGVAETINYVAVEMLPGSQSALLNGKRFQVGILNGFTDMLNLANSKNIFLQNAYVAPQIFLTQNSNNGGGRCIARPYNLILNDTVNNAGNTSVWAYVEDTAGAAHATGETFSYFVIEQ